MWFGCNLLYDIGLISVRISSPLSYLAQQKISNELLELDDNRPLRFWFQSDTKSYLEETWR